MRLLVGDTVHLDRLVGSDVKAGGQVAHRNATSRTIEGPARSAVDVRRLQAGPAETDKTADTGGMSMDTIAIVLTLLIGAAGYVMQARMPATAQALFQ